MKKRKSNTQVEFADGTRLEEQLHVGGLFVGRNPERGAPEFVGFNRPFLSDTNIFILGTPGSGKTCFVSAIEKRVQASVDSGLNLIAEDGLTDEEE